MAGESAVMRLLADDMKRYLKIYFIFVKNSFQLFLSHRFNFLMGITANIIWTISQLISLRFLFDKISTFQGWSFQDLILLLAFGQIYVYTSVLIYDSNISDLPKKIISGAFDRMLTKPININFLSSFETVAIAQFIPMITTVTPLLLYGLAGRHSLTLASLLFAFLFIILGNIAFYLLTLALIGLTFFVENALSIKDFITQRTSDLSRIPTDYFPKAIRYIITYAIPLAFVTYYPALVIRGRVDPILPLTSLLLLTILFYYLGHVIWQKGLKNYSGVG